MGELAPAPGARSPEAEALRRLRSFAVLTLGNDSSAPPSLEGLRVSERRLAPMLDAWLEGICRVAGPDHAEVRSHLEPILRRFRAELRTTPSAVRASGAPSPSKRRAVSAAIDRVSDAFLAIDPDTGRIADANPAAGALLATTRDALVGAEAMSFVPEPDQAGWWTELDAIAEGDGNRRFQGLLRDQNGGRVTVETQLTRFATRNRTLALCLARPV
ncbi:MAG: PAS domain-containing protein [bacterium]|nr:PAS domain-containing protein [bacterium]